MRETRDSTDPGGKGVTASRERFPLRARPHLAGLAQHRLQLLEVADHFIDANWPLPSPETLVRARHDHVRPENSRLATCSRVLGLDTNGQSLVHGLDQRHGAQLDDARLTQPHILPA